MWPLERRADLAILVDLDWFVHFVGSISRASPEERQQQRQREDVGEGEEDHSSQVVTGCQGLVSSTLEAVNPQ